MIKYITRIDTIDKKVNNCKKVVIPFSFLAELSQLPGKNSNSRDKQNYQEGKKLHAEKYFFKASVNK